ncbi:MAG: dTMP kinase [Candidatus Nitrohelix vancouverensis]|uniref:Thymidylate kinase n=1 Tax=Candidatus Nitrohelix vancouverensis TaxID=2705534 RepID=A0A7T0C310_9BACT|nr:MAG: dTMP kinase [Candidatus Nitrohelix vancouverensis]
MQIERGRLFVFEGIDGTGKSTQVQMAEAALLKQGFPARRLYEPTRGLWGSKIRKILEQGRDGVSPEQELEWFEKDRMEDVERNIRPALDNKEIILMDRYYYSTAAYQGALGLDSEEILKRNRTFAPAPDIAFFFQAPLDACFERIEARNEDRTSFEKRDYLIKVQSLFDSFDDPVIKRIDGSQSIEDVAEKIMTAIQTSLAENGL